MNLKLTKRELAALETIEHVTLHSNGVYQYCNTGRQFRAEVAERLEARGLLKSEMCVLVDGDGFILNGRERWRLGYALTQQGLNALFKAREAAKEGSGES